jgi:hypothetical protein
MEQIRNNYEYPGLPEEITLDELDQILQWGQYSDETADLQQLSEMITSHTYVDEIVEFDIRLISENTQNLKQMSKDDSIQYEDGINDGYYTVAGIMTAVNMIRFQTEDLNEIYFEALKTPGLVPALTDTESSELKIFFDRESSIENQAHVPEIMRLTASQHDVNQYILQSPALAGALGQAALERKQFVKKSRGSERLATAFSKGYAHGCNNALKMYLQSYKLQTQSLK